MKKNNFLKYFVLILLILFNNKKINAEIIVLSTCINNKDGFLKNEYILDLDKSLMTRNYVYTEKTFKKYRITDMSVKKENTLNRFIYEQNGKILTDKIGYPQYYTQLLFERDSQKIMIRTVINNEEGVSLLSNCKKIEKFEKES